MLIVCEGDSISFNPLSCCLEYMKKVRSEKGVKVGTQLAALVRSKASA